MTHDHHRSRRGAARHRSRAEHPLRRRGAGVPRAVGGAGLRDGAAAHDRGLFKWPEWAAILGDEIKKAQAAGDPDTGETYYRHWLAALERIVAEKGVTDAGTLRPLSRRLGSRRRPHAARHADRVEAGRLPLTLRSGVRMCSGRTPRPTSRAGMRRSTGNHCISRITNGGFGRSLLASAGDSSLFCTTTCIRWMTLIGNARRCCTAAR